MVLRKNEDGQTDEWSVECPKLVFMVRSPTVTARRWLCSLSRSSEKPGNVMVTLGIWSLWQKCGWGTATA